MTDMQNKDNGVMNNVFANPQRLKERYSLIVTKIFRDPRRIKLI
jgi:hypothetical protein